MSEYTIDSISRNQLKKLRNLNRKKARYEEREFLIEGERAIDQILSNGTVKIKALYFEEDIALWDVKPWRNYIKEYEAYKLGSNIFKEITDTDHPQGILARVEMPAETSADQLLEPSGVIVAFDAIQDPGNVGTIIRTATWFGCKGMLVGKGTVDVFHPKVVRSTAGTTGVLPYQTGDLVDLLKPFSEKGWHVRALDVSHRSVSLHNIEQSKPTILIAGNEAHGIRNEIKKIADDLVKIPGHFQEENYLDSLNVAITVGISLYELMQD